MTNRIDETSNFYGILIDTRARVCVCDINNDDCYSFINAFTYMAKSLHMYVYRYTYIFMYVYVHVYIRRGDKKEVGKCVIVS